MKDEERGRDERRARRTLKDPDLLTRGLGRGSTASRARLEPSLDP